MSETKKIYGIDLGTTYSAIAFVNELGKPEIIPNSDNDRITASVVFYDENQKVVVGDNAKQLGSMDADRVVACVKRQIPSPHWVFTIDDTSYKPEEISASILRRLAGDANAKTNCSHDVKDVVITCPAFFNDAERARTRAAGEIAGLNVNAIIDEPVAAAVYYCLNDKKTKGKNLLVYDLGGGTFDATVVSIDNDGNITTICTDGDHQLGGKDWDNRIAKYYVNEFQNRTGSNASPFDDPEEAFKFMNAVEEDKKTLSTDTDKVRYSTKHNGEKVFVELTREEFDKQTEDLLEQTFVLTEKMREEAKKKGIAKIDTFLLVGGSTRMKQVKMEFVKRYGVEPVDFDVDECVAKGAALYGELLKLKGQVDDNVKDRTQGKDFKSLPSAEQERILQEAVAEVAENNAMPTG